MDANRTVRSTWKGHAMSKEDALALLDAARRRFGAVNARLAVLIKTGAVERVVDNAADAKESLRRLQAREAQTKEG